MYGYIAYEYCIIEKKLHLSLLTENSGSGAVYACLGTVSKIEGGGIGLDSQEQDRADVTGSELYPACTYRMTCNWVKSGGV